MEEKLDFTPNEMSRMVNELILRMSYTVDDLFQIILQSNTMKATHLLQKFRCYIRLINFPLGV